MTDYQYPLKTFTDKEFKILALLEFIEDEMWINGMIMTLDDEEKIVNGDTFNKTPFEHAEGWKSFFNVAITDPNCKDGKHCGDSTNLPATCFRCMCEEQLQKVRKFVLNYEKIID